MLAVNGVALVIVVMAVLQCCLANLQKTVLGWRSHIGCRISCSGGEVLDRNVGATKRDGIG